MFSLFTLSLRYLFPHSFLFSFHFTDQMSLALFHFVILLLSLLIDIVFLLTISVPFSTLSFY